jgi:dihydropyrimidinase
LIRGGEIVTAEHRRRGDVRCQDGVIVELGTDLAVSGEEIVDAGDLLVLPGGVDPHVHMALPVAGTVSSDDFESGTAAGLAGGTTSIIDFVHPEEGQDPLDALAARRLEAVPAVADYGFHMAMTWWGETSADAMARCVAAGVPSFKIYMAYKDAVGLEDADLVSVLSTAADLDSLVIVHAEHGDAIEHLRDRFAAEGHHEPRFHALSRPSALEGEATNRIASLAGVLGARLYVVHVTCRESVEAIRRAQAEGWAVHGETCPQYLLLEDSVYDRPDFEGATYVIAPPIRPAGHQEFLWEALVDGTLEVVATDHCPFTMEQKELGRDDFRAIPGGAAGIEHRLSLLYTHGVEGGLFDLHRFVDLVSTGPARRFGLYPRKGVIEAGSDADLVLWDPAARSTVSAATDHHHCDRSLFEGFETRGAAAVVVAGGKVCSRNGQLLAESGVGRFLERRLS